MSNEKGVAYFKKRVARIQICYSHIKRWSENVKGTVKIKWKNVVFSFIEVYPSICFVDVVVHLRNRIQI